MKIITNSLIVIAAVVLIYFSGCSYRNVDDIKSHATNTWEYSGFEITGYEGYKIGMPFVTPGGEVWYVVRRKKSDSTTIYHGFLSKWGTEYHIYNLKAINSVGGK